MPELPEVETMVRGIRAECTGRVISRLEFVRNSCRPLTVSPDRETLIRKTNGQRVTEVTRLAKRILMSLDSAGTLVIEPRMTGLLLVTEPPTFDHRRVVWHFRPENGLPETLEFWDRRGLGTISLLNEAELSQLTARLGPDALLISTEEWTTRLKNTSREIKVALLDQQLVAGIGNLYASEILHRAGICPRRVASSLSRRQIQKLSESTVLILHEAIRYEGSTLGDGTYRNALNQDGGYQNHHRVYKKEGTQCPTCGRQNIQRIVQAQRATFFCAACQR